MSHSEEIESMDTDNDGEPVGSPIKGTNVSHRSSSGRHLYEDSACPAVVDDGHNRQILARMEKLLWECKLFSQLLNMATKMNTSLLEVPGVQLVACKRSRTIAMQAQSYDQCVINMIDEVEFDDCEEWTEEMVAMANGQMLAATFLSAQLAQGSNIVPDGALVYPGVLAGTECTNLGNIQIAENAEISDFRLAL